MFFLNPEWFFLIQSVAIPVKVFQCLKSEVIETGKTEIYKRNRKLDSIYNENVYIISVGSDDGKGVELC
jgi:hypothetical protein